MAIGKRIRTCNYRTHTNRKLTKLIRTGRGWQFDGSREGRIHATRRIWNSEISLAASEGPPTTTGRLPPFRPERYLDVVTHCDYVRCPSVGELQAPRPIRRTSSRSLYWNATATGRQIAVRSTSQIQGVAWTRLLLPPAPFL